MSGTDEKRVVWVGSSQKDLRNMPDAVRSEIGFALYEAQLGLMPASVKPLKGYKGAGVLEVVENNDGDTFRAVYTVRFEGVLYVLHAFQKKSSRGIATPKKELDLVEARLKEAARHYAAHSARAKAGAARGGPAKKG
ncbi:MAG: addiction module toxin RelE [Oceanicaulis sp.]|nr:addiction module toxin RelE [Oceanicaulis sp.]